MRVGPLGDVLCVLPDVRPAFHTFQVWRCVILGAGGLEEHATYLDILHLVSGGPRSAWASPKDGALVHASFWIVSILATSGVTVTTEAKSDLVLKTAVLRTTLLLLKGRAVGWRKVTCVARLTSAMDVKGARCTVFGVYASVCE